MDEIQEYTVVTWNVNFSGRTVDKYEIFSFANRANYILSNIKALQNKIRGNMVVFALQEVMPDYLDSLNSVFPDDQYTVYTKKIHDVGRMLYTAVPKALGPYKSQRFNIKSLGENFRDCWDIIDITDDNNWPLFTIVNLHAPMDAQYRLPICKHVAENTCFGCPTVIVGDLNTFSDGKGLEQIKSMENAGFKDVTGVLLRGSVATPEFEPVTPRVRVLETFDPYPYDNVPRENPEFFPFNLDHVFVHQIRDYSTVLCYDQERNVIFDGKSYGNSDHFALSFTFKC